MRKSLLLALLFAAVIGLARPCRAAYPDRYNVAWNSPSEDCHGSMPLGNGEIGLNTWIEPSGDLCFYISRTDSWGDNARLLKVGKVRITLDPSPLARSSDFHQVLRLRDGTMIARLGEGNEAATLRLWVDANRPAVCAEIQSQAPTAAEAHIELWRTERHKLPSVEVSDVLQGSDRPTIVEPDSLLKELDGRIGWYHHNSKSVGPELTMELQGLNGLLGQDPLLHRTFGGVITTEDGKRSDAHTLVSPAARRHRFNIYVLTRHPATPDEWLSAVNDAIERTESKSFSERRQAHEEWWRKFWDRSRISITASKASEPEPLVPPNGHSVRIGRDQSGGNQFVGRMGRVGIYDTALAPDRIRTLADTQPDEMPNQVDNALFKAVQQPPQTLDDSAGWSFDRGLAVEAWVRPEEMPQRGGRIVDDVTPGKPNGFLLDTYPGNSLRLIAGETQLQKRDALPPGRWSHVAATVDQEAGRIALYLDGEKIAERTVKQRSDAFVVSRGYTLQRFIDACAGRGAYPIKFNGSIFTVPYEGRPGGPDYRRWGPGYWWQNTRLPYYSMCASGDYELMHPLFDMYVDDLLKLCMKRTQRYFGHGGAYYPECIYVWGAVFSNTYGWTPASERDDKLQTSGWHKWEWVSGLELTWLMLDYYEYTLDREFLNAKALPFAQEILTFFNEHYPTNENGKLIMHPSQALETWWECTNPMPEVAGLRAVTARLLELPGDTTTPEQREFWRAVRGKLPELPTRKEDGTRMLAPAEKFANKRNIENPELYAVFPFRLIDLAHPENKLAVEALEHRWDRGNQGWRQDDIFMAYLGLTEKVREYVVGRARKSHSGSRFPAFWGPNYDWIPDQDHGSVLMKAVQSMLMQSDGRKIYLLPAWPEDWNVHFKLHAPYRTTVECRYEDGEVVSLDVSPASRAEDVVRPSERN